MCVCVCMYVYLYCLIPCTLSCVLIWPCHLPCSVLFSVTYSPRNLLCDINTPALMMGVIFFVFLTFALLGGGLLRTPFLFLSRLSKNGGVARCFWHTLSYIFSAHVVKISDPSQVTQGEVTRSRQVTSPHKKFEYYSTLHRLNDCLETFSNCYKKQCL